MTKRALVVGANLVVGNFILFTFNSAGLENPVEALQLGGSFSLSAITLLLIFFKRIKPSMSWQKLLTLSAVYSFLVPLFGMPLFMLNQTPTLETTIKGLALGALMSAVGWKLWIPMCILNTALFRWLSKSSS